MEWNFSRSRRVASIARVETQKNKMFPLLCLVHVVSSAKDGGGGGGGGRSVGRHNKFRQLLEDPERGRLFQLVPDLEVFQENRQPTVRA